MVTIKGPIHFKKGFSTEEMMKKVKGKIKVKLPFSATGWESTKMPEIADTSNIKIKEKKTKPKPKAKAKPKKKGK